MKKYLDSLRAWWRDARRKRRLCMHNATDNTEEWHMHISPASIFSAFVAFSLVLFILILTLMAYTPVLEFLPGYRTDANRSRENLIHSIIRLDSMERMMNDMMTYNDNIALILDGKTPVMRNVASADSTRITKMLIMPSHEDSLLRAQMEGEGEYAITGHAAASRRSVRESIEMTAPVEGIITERFDIREGRFGVRIAPSSDRVTAIENGTVVMSIWSPETGHIVQLQHAGNLLSIYKNLSQSLVKPGQTIRSGELVGNISTDGKGKLFEFELWNNGKPVDPEGYIVF